MLAGMGTDSDQVAFLQAAILERKQAALVREQTELYDAVSLALK